MLPSRDLILDAATEKGINPAFIEKDWYAVQLLKYLNQFENDYGVELVFSGGTSLSKGYGLIKRFSEDLDFILDLPKNLSRGERKLFRKSIIAHIRTDSRFTIDDDGIQCGDSDRFFKLPIRYDIKFKQNFLRPYLQLEMTFTNPKREFDLDRRDVQSIICELSDDNPETKITCISPIETAADKISALTWRVVVRDRDSEKYDPTIIRHLHDLAALKQEIFANKGMFIACAKESLQQDQKRGGDITAQLSISERLKQAFSMLSNDKRYEEEYQDFVQNMSYADEKDKIPFTDALSALRESIAIVS